jgi:hypothetical protein
MDDYFAYINADLAMLCLRWRCFMAVLKLDCSKRDGLIFGEEYQKELAHIRDYGVMNGLTARDIKSVFGAAHAETTSSVYKWRHS